MYVRLLSGTPGVLLLRGCLCHPLINIFYHNSSDVSSENFVLDQLILFEFIFFNSYRLISAWYLIDIVRRNSLMATWRQKHHLFIKIDLHGICWMVFSQVLAGFHAAIGVVGLPGNLLVIATICMESRFHVMRYVLLASLAGSDILFLILGNSPSIASTAHERWLYGETMCKLHYLVLRYFYLNTVLHLIAVSYERYSAIVKSPLTYNSSITRSKVVVIVLIWTVPFLVCAIAFFRQAESVFYHPKLFFCRAASDAPTFYAPAAAFIVIAVHTSIIFFLNWRVLKTVNAI